ncbi:hypothetical protein SEVIR_6G167100v4 [Setaria viridis]|uniref:Uncharacterized protein n=2 Tax=Setaria TaxID=4554 RepID=K3YI84_SETIT|nr:uncharacterized protein LOC101778047 [Setaria italica]XP_034601532.1 uncharacterized protein LOC117862122 [Setaria viridis]RCV31248.1 hypothetical protein SETIT_6G161400v2 [Setaria italica]TKW10476.1 hypothetical protein SEVIR_6G167100v2 [Setaria viridis]
MARPPDLIDDATTEILLRLPPDDPACLVRASLVCKAWRELLSGPAFLRRYRAFHGAPPLLGFLRNIYDEGPRARFVVAAATGSASPFSAPAFDRPNWWVVECRHGRALLQSFEQHEPRRLVVWDPITGDQQHVPVPDYPYFCRTAAVLCAADGCGHLDCHGGPFLVVVIGAYDDGDLSWASVYSSETGAWTTSSSIRLDAYIEERPSLLAGDALYFSILQGNRSRILKYDLVGRGLQLINVPDMYEETDSIVVTSEDGGLGLAGVKDGNLHLWTWQAGPQGVAEWVQGRMVKLRMLLPVIDPLVSLDVIGFIEGKGTIFISSDVGVFAVMPKSGQVKKVGERGSYTYCTIAPYVSFYTPDLAKGRLLPP